MAIQGAAAQDKTGKVSRNNASPLWFFFPCVLVLLTGCGEERLRNRFGTLRSEEVPVRLKRA